MSIAPDTRLGAYKILSLLGEGAMGELYRVRDITLGRELALRLLPEDFGRDPKRLERFRSEVQTLTSLNHPRIAGVYALSEENRAHFLILEFVQGITLAERLNAGPLAVADALLIARQVGEALKVAHAKGIVHGDLKPANVSFATNDRVKVLDFGLARAMEVATGRVADKNADKRNDVWGFGCVLYEMLTGQPPFPSVSDGKPDWSALPADVPESIRTVIQGCLESDLEQRIADIPTALSLLNAPPPPPPPVAVAPPPIPPRSPAADVVKPGDSGIHRTPRPRPAVADTPAPRRVVPIPAPSSADAPRWRLVATIAVPVVLVLIVGTYLMVGRNRAQPDTAPAPQAEAPVPPPASEVTATPDPAASSAVLLTNRRPSSGPSSPRLTSGAVDRAFSLFPGSATEGLQELDRLAELSRSERSSHPLTDDERGLHRQLFLDRADRNVRIDPAKTDDSLREFIRIDPTYSPRLAPELRQRLDAVRSRDTGTLLISSPVAGSTIRVDGVVVGVTGAKPLQVRVMPGEVEIRAHKDDFPRDGTSRANVTVGATVAISNIAPRRIAQPIVLVVDRLDADIYVRKASVGRVVFNLDPRVNTPGEVLLNQGVAQKPVKLSVWKAQAPLTAAVELDRKLAGTGLDPAAVGVFVVPQDAIEYNRAIQVLFLGACYRSDGRRIVLKEEFLKANEAAPLLWLDDASIVRLAPDPLNAGLPQCRALKP